MKDITRPIGLVLFILLIVLAFYSKSEAKDNKYEVVIENIIKQDIDFKPKKIKFPGYNHKMSVGSKYHNGGMAEITGASDIAYNGNTFYSVAVDFSKCNPSHYGFSDCKHGNGSSRVEFTDKNWTFTNGTERWINYAFLPANNILFDNRSRNFHIGQCHPEGNNITWMVTIKESRLVLMHNFKSWQRDDGTWMQNSINTWASINLLKKFDKANEHNGSLDWINIRINFKNSKNPDGKLKVWVNGELKYDYEGPTNWDRYKGFKGKENKCAFKFGLYTNANATAVKKDTAENMIVFVDYMAIAKTEAKLEKLLKKDK